MKGFRVSFKFRNTSLKTEVSDLIVSDGEWERTDIDI